MMLDKLKEKRFTRIKYGKQKWVKEIDQVWYSTSPTDQGYAQIKVIIIDKEGGQWDLEEIGLV